MGSHYTTLRKSMADIKILTNSKMDGKPVAVQGSKVQVGGVDIDRVVDVRLDADLGHVWKLTLTVFVDPNTLFEVLPEEAEE